MIDNSIVIDFINNNQAYITLKSSLNGFTNYEFEYQIPIQDALELFNLSKYKITKTRYHLKISEKSAPLKPPKPPPALPPPFSNAACPKLS